MAVVVLDLDCFYAQVEEVLDETQTLHTRPLAIKQKQIVVTCNYNARALGVRKLQRLRDARAVCPELLIINGEDISRYRNCSNQIYALLSDILSDSQHCLKAKIQRMGLDEYFIDVEDMIYDHFAIVDNNSNLRWESKEVFFEMPGGEYVNSFISKFGADIMPRGFTYIPTEFSGKVLGTERESQTLVVASHIATYLRMCVKKILGFTCSCGIAKNKMLAKLASNVNKPDDQTTVSANEREVLEFVGNHGVGSIPGIGFASRKILMQKLNPQQRTVPENTVGEPDPFLRMNESALDLPDADNLLPTPTIVAEDVWYYNVNVSNILRQCTALNFKEWFGDEHGLRYWDLMHGIDGSKVVQSTLPSNISVEDSFGKCETFEDLEHHLRNLARLLIERLREEEFEWDRPFIDAETIPRWILGYKAGKEYFGLSNNSDNSKIKQKYGKNAPASNKANQFNVKGNWRRHAKSLRLTVRRRDPSDKAVMGARESRSTVMPLEVYNTTKAISELVNILVSPLYPILRSLLGSSQPEALNLINIGAADFIQGPPMKTITSFFAAKPKQKECSEKTVISEREKLPSQDEKDSLPENVSLEVWNELPKHIQTELRVANAISSQSNNFGNTRVTGGKRTRDEPRQRNTKSKKTSANVKKADASAYFKKSFQS